MLVGTVLAQTVPLLASPLLTRLYGPEAFGIQALFMSLAGALAVLATCRLDLAIVLPESDEEAGRIAAIALGMTAVVCAVFVLLAATAAPLLASLAGYADQAAWLWMLPVMVGAISLMQVCVAFASRRRNFKRIAAANVLNQAIYTASAIGVGLGGAWVQGLALAKLTGQAVAVVLLGGSSGTRPRVLRLPELGVALELLSRYRQFILYNTPYSLVGSVARDAPIFIYSASSATAAAGFYGLARAMLLAPTLLVSNALSQVFYREAVDLKGSPRLEVLTLFMLKCGLVVGAPLFAFGAIWSDELFATVFGSNWRPAGIMAMLLAPAAWMSVQTGWPERLFEVHMRQGVSLSVQLGSDLVTAVMFAAAWIVTHDAVFAIAVFVVCNVLYHHFYLLMLFRVSGFSVSSLSDPLLAGWGIFAASAALFCVLRFVFGTGWATIGISMMAAVAAAIIALQLSRATQRSVSTSGDTI